MPGALTTRSRLLGAHMPAAGGVCQALYRGREIGCTAVQLFTSSPQQRGRPLKDDAVRDYHAALAETGMRFVVSHDSYLINLASPDPDLLERSRVAFREEIERAAQLAIPWVVTHMGAHTGSGEDEGLRVLTQSVRRALAETAGVATGIALEVTAGQGTSLGHRFEHIAQVMHEVGACARLGSCLDTCHAFAAGYDLRTREQFDAVVAELDEVIGLANVRAIHANDAKRPLASRVDRHEHIGRGEIGAEPFRWLVTDPRLLHIPIILETPEAETMHRVNLRRLRGFTRPPRKRTAGAPEAAS